MCKLASQLSGTFFRRALYSTMSCSRVHVRPRRSSQLTPNPFLQSSNRVIFQSTSTARSHRSLHFFTSAAIELTGVLAFFETAYDDKLSSLVSRH